MKKTLITLGEPAGIGPDLCVLLSEKYLTKNLIVIADPELIRNSAKTLKKNIRLNVLENINSKTISGKFVVNVLPVELTSKNKPGKLDPKNASYVIKTIKMAAELCMKKEAAAMVTGPISKSVLNDGGFKISGHTEFLANICNMI